MARTKKQEKQEMQMAEVAPKREVKETEKVTKFIMKEEHFNKTKTFIEKDTGLVKEVPANWRKLHLNGTAIVCYEGQPLTQNELSCFNKEAKEYYLEKVK